MFETQKQCLVKVISITSKIINRSPVKESCLVNHDPILSCYSDRVSNCTWLSYWECITLSISTTRYGHSYTWPDREEPTANTMMNPKSEFIIQLYWHNGRTVWGVCVGNCHNFVTSEYFSLVEIVSVYCTCLWPNYCESVFSGSSSKYAYSLCHCTFVYWVSHTCMFVCNLCVIPTPLYTEYSSTGVLGSRH